MARADQEETLSVWRVSRALSSVMLSSLSAITRTRFGWFLNEYCFLSEWKYQSSSPSLDIASPTIVEGIPSLSSETHTLGRVVSFRAAPLKEYRNTEVAIPPAIQNFLYYLPISLSIFGAFAFLPAMLEAITLSNSFQMCFTNSLLIIGLSKFAMDDWIRGDDSFRL